jgi:cytochrome c-type biogenesis protein CcmE
MKRLLAIVLFLSISLFTSLNIMSAKAEVLNKPMVVDMEKAKQIALGKVAGKVVNATIQRDDGMIKYEITIQAKDGKYEVEIDKATGKVLEVEKESGAGNDQGDDDDHHEGEDDHDDD